ncbi:hypothetical protein PR048_005632 [Dryococelus australis]|uniref:Integrase catalytic domain-containing protein n=1 Tax=Dryococelus australis TaxID=614101 RepID=A0ABQ9I8T0_9NEOP|nr:hypothetical protein PR048_005632 [Dryococelus australis]
MGYPTLDYTKLPPQGNLIERRNHELKEGLCILVQGDHRNQTPIFLFTLHRQRDETLGTSLNELLLKSCKQKKFREHMKRMDATCTNQAHCIQRKYPVPTFQVHSTYNPSAVKQRFSMLAFT